MTKLDSTLQKRAEKLGQLLAKTLLPRDVVVTIEKELGNFTVRQIDLLIDGLEREQAEWLRLEKMFLEQEKGQNERQAELQTHQAEITKKILNRIISDAEGQEVEQLKKTIEKLDD